jgi:hypothetical protein
LEFIVCTVLFLYINRRSVIRSRYAAQVSQAKKYIQNFCEEALKNRRLFGGSSGKRSGRFCGADCAILMELSHGFEMKFQVVLLTGSFYTALLRFVCYGFSPSYVVMEPSVGLLT